MPRSTSLTKAILSGRSLRFVDCVKIELTAGTLLYTNYEADLQLTSIDGSTVDTYKTGQGYLGHSAITTTSQAQPEKVDITFDSSQLDSTANLIGPAFAMATQQVQKLQYQKFLLQVQEQLILTILHSEALWIILV